MKKNKKLLIFSLLVLTIICLSIGYSTYKSDLKITGIASNVRPITDIRVTGMNLEIDSTGTSTYNEYNYDRIITGFSVSDDQYMRYKVTITNIGSTEMAITDISGIPETLNLSLENYSLNEKLCNDNNECKLGISKEFYIKLSRKQTDSIEEIYNLNLVFTFKEIHKINYVDIENNNYPVEIVDGKSLNINFGESAPSNVIVKMDGVEIADYTYENNVLTIPNVTGDIIIKKSVLLNEYQQVEYIQSSGGQYIDTGYAFTDNFSWEIDFEGLVTNSVIFGGGTSSNRTAILYQLTSSTTLPIGTNTAAQTPFDLGDLSKARHIVKMSASENKGSIWVDGTQQYDNYEFEGDYITGVTQTIFANNLGDGVIEKYSFSKVYNVKMWQGENLVRNFNPCYNKETGDIGMCDIVEGRFYPNLGTGNFTKGDDIQILNYKVG